MPTNRKRRTRVPQNIPPDHWNMLLCRPLKNPFSQFYSDDLCMAAGEPTIREVYEQNKEFVLRQWKETGRHPSDYQLKDWGVSVSRKDRQKISATADSDVRDRTNFEPFTES